MKLTIPTIMIAAVITIASASPLQPPSNISVGSTNLPDDRFTIVRKLDAAFLPVVPTFLNILHMMCIIAILDLDTELRPRTYSAPGYRQVQITSYTWTEARFLLWGIYTTVLHMIKDLRFHDSLVDLFWEDRLVGRLKIETKTSLSLPDSTDEDAGSLQTDGGEINQRASQYKSARSPVNDTISLSTVTATKRATAESDVNDDLLDFWDGTNVTTSTLPTHSPMNASVSVNDFLVDFTAIDGALALHRNDVFLTFYAAILHLAQFPPAARLSGFESKSPLNNVWLVMSGRGNGCQVRPLLSAQ